MNRERKEIEQNTIVVFEGDVNASELNGLFQDFQGDVVISGDVILDGENLSIKCDNLYVIGGLILSDNVSNNNICLNGNLYVENSIDSADIHVNGCIYCMGSIDSFDINVSEDLCVNINIYTNGYDINVGGDFICENDVEAAEITVLKKISVRRIQADKISVG